MSYTNTPFLFTPVFRALDNAGAPLSGGKLYTYLAGSSSTLQATYSDTTGTSQNTNPVILDTTGSATVRLIPGAKYHLVLKDSTDVTTLWDVDYYDTNAALTQSSLGQILYPTTAAETAASVTPVSYSYSPRPVNSVWRQMSAAQIADAIAGGLSYDLTTAVQAAINACPSGGEVIIPCGFIKFSSLSSTRPVVLRGEGYTSKVQDIFGAAAWSTLTNFGGSVLVSTAAAGDAILMGTAGTNQNIQLKDLMVIGPGSGTATGIHMLRGVGSYVQNVLLANFYSGWNFDNEQDAVYVAPRAKGCKTGMTFGGSITSNQTALYGPEVQSYDTFGINAVAIAHLDIFGGILQDGRGGYGVQIGSACSQNTLNGVWFESTSVTGAINVLGANNKLSRCNFSNAKDHVYIGNGADRNKIEDCVLQPVAGESPSIMVVAGATNTRIVDSVPYASGLGPGGSGATYQDAGTNTIYITTDSGVVNQQSGGRAVLGSDSMNGISGAAGTSTRLTKKITAMADATFTSILSVNIPNAAHSAKIRLTADASLGAGGAVGANEGSMTLSEDVIITRTAGLTAVIATSATYGSAAANVAGGATCTIAFDNSSLAGAAGATQTLTMRASITRGSGASTNHTCVVHAEILNSNTSGITIS